MPSGSQCVVAGSHMRLVVSMPGFAPPERPRWVAWCGDTVLVALEDAREREWLGAMLRYRGYRVLSARHAGQALLMALRFLRSIDVLVTEHSLREMSGHQLSDLIRDRCPELEVVYATRPLAPTAVLDAVREVLGDRRPSAF